MIRYKIDVLEELKRAGFTSYRMRQEKLLAESTMQKLRSGNTNLSLENLGQICALLHCQPGDLIEWVED